jgi:hypothetical protein
MMKRRRYMIVENQWQACVRCFVICPHCGAPVQIPLPNWPWR